VSALQAKMDRLDALLDRKLVDREAEQARADASLEDARRAKMRDNAEARRLIAQTYDDAFRSFGVTRLNLPMTKRLQRSESVCSTGWRANCRLIMTLRNFALTISGHSPSCSTISRPN
jgi:hypothetical protein